MPAFATTSTSTAADLFGAQFYAFGALVEYSIPWIEMIIGGAAAFLAIVLIVKAIQGAGKHITHIK